MPKETKAGLWEKPAYKYETLNGKKEWLFLIEQSNLQSKVINYNIATFLLSLSRCTKPEEPRPVITSRMVIEM